MTLPCNRFPHSRTLPPMGNCPICNKHGILRICACCGSGCDVPSCHERHCPDEPATVGPDRNGIQWCADCAMSCPPPDCFRRAPAGEPEVDMSNAYVPATGKCQRRPKGVQLDLFHLVTEAEQLDLFQGVDL